MVHALVVANQPYQAQQRAPTLITDFVTASEAWQSMHPQAMDCFTAFAMTAIYRKSGHFLFSN